MREVRQRRPRKRCPKFLKWLKTEPCAICLSLAPSDPAHLRSASREHDKEYPGRGAKPDDRWATPLCRLHHDMQHYGGYSELAWWRSEGFPNPFALAISYYNRFTSETGYVEPPPRKKRAKKKSKFAKRKTQWPKRKMQSRADLQARKA